MVGQVLIEAAGLDKAEYGGGRDNRRLSGRAVSRSGRDVSRRIIRREPQDDWVYLFS